MTQAWTFVARCTDVDCGHWWRAVIEGPIHLEQGLECSACHGLTGAREGERVQAETIEEAQELAALLDPPPPEAK